MPILKNGRTYLLGIGSGIFASLVFVTSYGTFLTFALMIRYWDVAYAFFLLPFLGLGLPIGLIVGAVYGLLVSAAELNRQIKHLDRSMLLLGAVTGCIYPLVLLLFGDDPLVEDLLALVGGIVCGATSGLLGCKDL